MGEGGAVPSSPKDTMGSTETSRRRRDGALNLVGLLSMKQRKKTVEGVDLEALWSRASWKETERYLTVLSTATGESEVRRGRLPRARALARSGHGGQGDGEARGDLPGGGEGERGTEVN